MIDTAFEQMCESFQPGKVDTTLSYYFSIDEQKKSVYIGPQECRVEEGKTTEEADCVCKTSADLFLRIWNQDYRPGLGDFLSGKIRSNNPDALKTFLGAFDKPV